MNHYFQHNLSGLLTLASSVISLSVGLLVLSRDWRSPLQRSFFLITATGALWLFAIAMVQIVRNAENAFLWISVNYAIAVPYISPSVYLFSLYWAGKSQNLKVARLGFAFATLLGCLSLLFPRQIFFLTDVPGGRFDQFHHTPIGMTFLGLITLLFSTYATFAFLNFFEAWKEAKSPARRIQCRLFLIAASIGYTGSVDFFVSAGFKIYPFGYISFFGFVLLIAYAIVRHRFLNVDVFIKKLSLIFFIYSFLVATVLPFAVPVISHLLSKAASTRIWPMVITSVGIGLTLSLGPIIYAYLTRHNTWIRGHLAAGLTHELRSPLSAIQSAVEIMQSGLKKHPSGFNEEYLRMIQSNADRLDRFIRDLLNVVQIQEGRVSIRRDSFDLREILRKEVSVYEALAVTRLIKIDYRPNGPVNVVGDEDKLRQVLSNILSNAVKFSPDHSDVFVTLAQHNYGIQCAVADKGAGVPKDALNKIFDQFYCGSNSGKGAGLGLAIAKGWVEAHGGRIWAESEGNGKGTTVTFTLPSS
jgi:signal transduction histidine kinase